MADLRPVYYVHRPLDLALRSRSAGPSTHSGGLQVFNHEAVEIAHLDPTTQQTISVTRFELLFEERKGVKDVLLNVLPYADPTDYKGASLGPIKFFGDITGWTSYSDAEIASIATSLITKHGKYNLLSNSCKHWAVEFFNTVCNAQASRRALYMGEQSAFARNTTYSKHIWNSIRHPFTQDKIMFKHLKDAASAVLRS